jgi:uncharacterized protein YdeI (BOF family)
MSKTISIKAFLPIAVAAIAAMIIAPAFIVSAAEGDDAERRCDNPHPRFHVAEVIEIDTDANTILVQGLRAEEGSDEYVMISYDNETTIKVDKEEADESAIKVGDKIHAKGEVNTESDEYRAEIDADHIMIWDELEPRPPKQFKGGERPNTEA